MHERERWGRVEQIFHSALERDEAERAGYIRQECAGDEELLRRVESLLARDDETSPLDKPLRAEPQVRTIGHYRLVAKLGEGGMGTVYLARDANLNRDVALKTLPPIFAMDGERRRRFLREARAASALSHPNIVSIYDFGQEDGLDYYVMEYIRGKPLDRLIPRAGLKLHEALSYAVPIADALRAAHEAGIIHRDIKPSNIIVDDQGAAKLLDFGIAKLDAAHAATSTATSNTETGEGMVIGTVAYMSPEQAEGRSVDARSDIFSFGSLLYEMVTGRRAFERASNASTLAAILRDNPPDASSLVENVPPELHKVLERCLEKDPAQRYPRMAEVVADLERVRARAGRAALNLRPLWYAAAFLLVCAAAAWWYVKTRDVPRAEAESPKVEGSAERDAGSRLIPVTSYPGQESEPSFSPDGNQVVFTYRKPGEGPGHIFIKLIGQNDAVQLTRGPAEDISPAWSPDGRWIAFVRYKGPLARGWPVGNDWALMLIPAIGGAERRLAQLGPVDSPDHLSWHPGGKWVALMDRANSGADAIHIFSVADGARRQITTPPPGAADASPAFSPDGKRIVFTRASITNDQDLYVLEVGEDLTPRTSPRRLTFAKVYAREAAWMPDGRSVLYSAGSPHSPTLWRIWVEPNGLEPRKPQLLAAAGVGVRSPAVSSRGQLAFAHNIIDADIWRVNLTGQAGVERVVASTRLDHTVKFSPDGTKLAFASERSGAHEIWVSDADGKNALQLTSFGGPYTAEPYWSPDGQWVSFNSQADGDWAVYTIPAQGGAVKRVTDPRLKAQGGSWTQDGRWIYCLIQGQLWKTPAGGGSPVQITRNGGAIPAQSPDGHTIYYAKQDLPITSLWAVSADGGEERQILPTIFSHNFVVRGDGIYYIPSPEDPAIWFYSFATRKASIVAKLRSAPAYGMDVSPDGRVAMVPELEDAGGDIMMMEHFQ